MKRQHKHSKLLLTTSVITSAFVATFIAANLTAPDASATPYSPYCTSAACRKAADAAAAATAKASEASQKANSYQGEIDRRTAEIAELESAIAANKAEIADLETRITDTKDKLKRQRAALAKLTVKMYHDGNTKATAIDILASSESISDLTEKQSRQETIEEQITKSAKEVNDTKKDLEQQQESVKEKLAANDNSRKEAAAKRAELNEIQAKYQNDAAGFSAYAAEQQAIVAAETAKQAAQARQTTGGGGSVVINGYVNNYDWLHVCPGANASFADARGFSVCQCTSYASWKVQSHWGINLRIFSRAVTGQSGNAKYWIERARSSGFATGTTPAAYSVAVSRAGEYGHVMWVEKVNPSGSINITEYNGWCGAGKFCAREIKNPNFEYIYFR